MSARFRPVWLVTDPITGARGVLGFVIDDPEGRAFVRDESTVWPTEGTESLAKLVARLLEAEPTFDAPPLGAGPQIVFGEAAKVPASVAGARAWVSTTMLATRAA